MLASYLSAADELDLGAYLDQHSLCIHAPTCGTALAMEHNGDVYSCDHFVEPGFRLGNIHSETLVELVAKPQQRAFGEYKRDSLPRMCRECDVRFACHGGCPKDRIRTTPDGEDGLNYLCPSYKRFFGHTAPAFRRMAARLGRKIVHLPLQRFSGQLVERLRTFHVLNGREVRSYAADFIREG